MIEKLKGKCGFFDVDGTISEYRYNDRPYGEKCPDFKYQSPEDLLFNDLYYRTRPIKAMKKL